MSWYAGKTAIVTGGASGIGRALCRELARRGAAVTVADINAEGARQAAEEIRRAGGRAVAAPLDVTDREAVAALVERTAAGGRLDFLFNNAGVCLEGEVRDMTPEHWKWIININLWGVIYGATAALPIMARQGGGHIVNVASAAGLLPIPTQAAYTTTKFAVVGFSRALRLEGAGLGVRVTVVCPGFVETNIVAATPFLKVRSEDLLAQIPVKMIPPERLAARVLDRLPRNPAAIIEPPHIRALAWAYRFSPRLLEATLGRWMVRKFRAIRQD
jgi:NAD(P)-dependent dehydrogenase (short-subunit alcohol dehydrogenase family)